MQIIPATFKLDVRPFSAFIYHHKVNVDCTMQWIQKNETMGIETSSLYTSLSLYNLICPQGLNLPGKGKFTGKESNKTRTIRRLTDKIKPIPVISCNQLISFQ